MFGLPDAAIGAITAALIAGLISLLGLIVSKEQKTSEFRQAWIDALRVDLSAYLTQINAVHDAVKVKYKTHAEKVTALSPLYIALNTSTFNIQLRINPSEPKSQRLLSAMNDISALTLSESSLKAENIRPAEIEFISASQELLKFEWRRVKGGEWTFKISKIIALAIVVASFVAIVGVVLSRTYTRQTALIEQKSNPVSRPDGMPVGLDGKSGK